MLEVLTESDEEVTVNAVVDMLFKVVKTDQVVGLWFCVHR